MWESVSAQVCLAFHNAKCHSYTGCDKLTLLAPQALWMTVKLLTALHYGVWVNVGTAAIQPAAIAVAHCSNDIMTITSSAWDHLNTEKQKMVYK